MTTPKKNSFRNLAVAAVIGATALYLFSQGRNDDSAQRSQTEPAASPEHENQPALAEPQAMPEPKPAPPIAMPDATRAPWMNENAARASTPPALKTPPSRPAPEAANLLSSGSMNSAAADEDTEAALKEARRSIRELRESHGSGIVGNIQLDVLEKNLDVAQRLNDMASELQQFQQANPDMDPSSPEVMKRIKELTELSGKLDMNFLVDQSFTNTQKK